MTSTVRKIVDQLNKDAGFPDFSCSRCLTFVAVALPCIFLKASDADRPFILLDFGFSLRRRSDGSSNDHWWHGD
jgi:hypothetical protein